MKVYLNNDMVYRDCRRVSIALGTFDGIHRGHQKLINELIILSDRYNNASMAYTFLNHPLDVINPTMKPPLLMTVKEKLLAFKRMGLDYVALVPFDRELASVPYRQFIEKLVHMLPIEHVVIGYNFNFGYKGEGNAERLIELGKEYRFQVHVISPVIIEGETVSSTRIRQYIRMGDLEKTYRLLGRIYSIGGKIVHGKEIGRTIGCPTANLSFHDSKVIPQNGVYISLFRVNGVMYPSITSVGRNPTIGRDNNISLETHILRFNQNIYGNHARVYFIKKIRDEIKFDDKEQLAERIRTDIQIASDYFSKRKNFSYYQENGPKAMFPEFYANNFGIL